ncbi:FG-GAP repeat domain-containing protein [Pseudooceanicola marinus]|uniref:FG-GAP repeat domain-containing protein n=1 Tax=Pseudooceanicola marinus TaxID=396013 RepID=UPI001CD3925D|nr:VCBS repeat-containing protein [Pseudooceanicola marinus]MCA1335019.1 VCBS repeat-containing protein [Pseudooceanicola marinus]
MARAWRRGRGVRRAALLSLAAALLWPAPDAPAQAVSQILSARYADPTTRYAHGVLGDEIEYGTLELTLPGEVTRRFTLDPSLVFEDVAPRLSDLDDDGAPEVIVVESHRSRGARLAVWNAEGRITATPAIGQAFRWLAPLGAADLDGDGRVEIAYVDRPHLAKTLRIWRYDPAARTLSAVAQSPGVSNHRIGWAHIPGGLRDCGTGPEMILADADWQSVLALRLTKSGQITRRGLGPYLGPDSLDAALAACD